MTIPTPANDLRSRWIAASVEFADGSVLELRIPAAVAASIASFIPAPDEEPALILADPMGQRRRARLTKLFSP